MPPPPRRPKFKVGDPIYALKITSCHRGVTSVDVKTYKSESNFARDRASLASLYAGRGEGVCGFIIRDKGWQPYGDPPKNYIDVPK